jgi:hypothetical protein
MIRLGMDWWSIGEMTIGEVKTCLFMEEKIRKANNQELHQVILVATVNANGGKNGKPIELYSEKKEVNFKTPEVAKKERELLGLE